jgi:hypothetical protein
MRRVKFNIDSSSVFDDAIGDRILFYDRVGGVRECVNVIFDDFKI